jgi:hypothetical protein
VRRYLLTPTGRVANLVLAALLVVGIVVGVAGALDTGGWDWMPPALSVLVLAGVLRHYPPTYGAIALFALIGMTLALNHARVQVAIAYVLVVVLALYARSQMLERVETPPA